MTEENISYDTLRNAWHWMPIRDCPGRFRLDLRGCTLPPKDLVGEAEVTEHRVPAARDPVLIARIDGGGLISYRRADGTYVHTLNTPEGFARKLVDLGLD